MSRRLSRRQLLGGAVGMGLAAAGAGALGDQAVYAATTPGGMAPSGAKGLGPGGALLAPDSLPYPHLPPGTDTLPQIEHIVVLMMENHSFDDHLGMLGRGDGLTLDQRGVPVDYNPDAAGGYVRSFHNPNTSGYAGNHINQAWDTSHECWDHGTNLGFVNACGPAAMGYWTADDLPFYYSMLRQFPIGDRYFCSVMAQTYPNRRFLIAGTALGDVSTSSAGISFTDAPNGTIFDRLDAHGLTWKDYYPDVPTCALFLPEWDDNKTDGKVVQLPQFFADAASGQLPDFAIVDPYTNFSEESNDISIGEAYAARVIDALMSGPAWHKTMIIWNYDEHGGWYDHVPPIPAVRPDNVPPEIHVPPDQPGGYDYTGFRVPMAVISAWSKRDHVSHLHYDHTSVLKTVESKWNLPALTYRDANALPLYDLLDLHASAPPFADPPTLAKPLNPFVGPLPATSFDESQFHQISHYRPGPGPAPGAHVSVLPSDTEALLAAHRRDHSY